MWKHLFSLPWFCFMWVDSKIKFPTSNYLNKCCTWLARGIHWVSIYNMYNLANFPLHYLCKHYSRFDLFTHVTNRCISTWVSTCNVNVCTYSVFGDGMGWGYRWSSVIMKYDDDVTRNRQCMRWGYRWYTDRMSSMKSCPGAIQSNF